MKHGSFPINPLCFQPSNILVAQFSHPWGSLGRQPGFAAPCCRQGQFSFSHPSPWPCWRHFASCALLPIWFYNWLLECSWERCSVGFFSFLSGLLSLMHAALSKTLLPLYCSATLSWIKLELPREWALNKPKIIILHFNRGKTSALTISLRS